MINLPEMNRFRLSIHIMDSCCLCMETSRQSNSMLEWVRVDLPEMTQVYFRSQTFGYCDVVECDLDGAVVQNYMPWLPPRA